MDKKGAIAIFYSLFLYLFISLLCTLIKKNLFFIEDTIMFTNEMAWFEPEPGQETH